MFLMFGLLLSMSFAVSGEGTASVMDKDGDGKVSMEEFVEHAAEQKKVWSIIFLLNADVYLFCVVLFYWLHVLRHSHWWLNAS
jgi:hypothetical protein